MSKLSDLKKELERRNRAKNKYWLYPFLSPLQVSVIESTARFKVVRASRRSGKSTMIIDDYIYSCLSTKNMKHLYVGATRQAAKDILWVPLKERLFLNNIPHTIRETDLLIEFRTGSTIKLVGAAMENTQDRLRGQAFKKIWIDECGFNKEADSLATTLMPSLADYDGTLGMASSPGEPRGLFYEADTGNQKDLWAHWFWTMKDNPFFKDRWEKELELMCQLKFGGNKNHPDFRREYLGEWVLDDTNLLYKFNHEKNITQEIPRGLTECVFGLDLGKKDACALVVAMYNSRNPTIYLVDCWKQAEISIEELVKIIIQFMQKYSPSIILTDCGGLGAMIAEEIRCRYGLPIVPAVKSEKAAHIRIMNSDFQSGFIKCLPGFAVIEEWCKVIKDDEKGIEKEKQEVDLADAALYAYRYCYADRQLYYNYGNEVINPMVGKNELNNNQSQEDDIDLTTWG